MLSPVMQPKKEIFQIRRSKDPISNRIGADHGFHFKHSAVANPVIYYRGRHGEFFLTLDLYQPEGAPPYLLMYCPLHSHDSDTSIRIARDNKRFEYEPDRKPRFPGYREEELLAGLELPSLGGALSVEAFGCTWEADPSFRRAGRGIGGFSICPFRVAIDQNIARDA